jgi:tRNA (guanine26-N2/guanine27-N2)-dimethyltransferase
MEKIVSEGKVKLKIDSNDIVSKELEVFYNPKMNLNRSLTIHLLNILEENNLDVCLPLAGTGVRAVRILKEVENVGEKINKIYVNDLNPKLVDYLNHNLELNNLKKIGKEKLVVSVMDAKKLLLGDFGFNYIDIDPYGSPNFLLDLAINKISDDGILVITATDTAPLAGTYPKTCVRKYWAKPLLCPQKHELGLRILCRKAQLLGLSHNKAMIPILSYHFEHYYRIFFKVKRGKIVCNKLFENFGDVYYDKKTGDFGIFDLNNLKENKIEKAGPMYLGELQNKEIISKMINICEEKSEEKKLLMKLFEESSLNLVGYYDIHDVCEKNKLRVISCEEMITKLKAKKYLATRISTNPYGIRTNADIKEFTNCIKDK